MGKGGVCYEERALGKVVRRPEMGIPSPQTRARLMCCLPLLILLDVVIVVNWTLGDQ